MASSFMPPFPFSFCLPLARAPEHSHTARHGRDVASRRAGAQLAHGSDVCGVALAWHWPEPGPPPSMSQQLKELESNSPRCFRQLSTVPVAAAEAVTPGTRRPTGGRRRRWWWWRRWQHLAAPDLFISSQSGSVRASEGEIFPEILDSLVLELLLPLGVRDRVVVVRSEPAGLELRGQPHPVPCSHGLCSVCVFRICCSHVY